MLLDVGCGSRPKGDVNLDINYVNVDNFVLADALKLPFRFNSFDFVFSSGLSFWRKHFDDDLILKSFMEALKVSERKVVFEYNYNKYSTTWDVKDPYYSFKLFRNVIPMIKMAYSKNGKYYKFISSIEKIVGTKFVIKLLNIIGKSYLVKFEIN